MPVESEVPGSYASLFTALEDQKEDFVPVESEEFLTLQAQIDELRQRIADLEDGLHTAFDEIYAVDSNG